MKSSVIRFLDRFAKFFLLIFVVNMVFAKSIAQGTDYEKELAVFKSIVESNGDEWMCYWQMNVWDRPPYLADAKVVLGLSGYSDIEIDKSKKNYVYLTVKDFCYDYNFGLCLESNGPEITLYDLKNLFYISNLTNQFGNKGYVQIVNGFEPYNDDQFVVKSSINGNGIINTPAEIYSSSNESLKFTFSNGGTGVLLSRDWKGDYGSMSNNTSIKCTYFHSLELTFVRKNDVFAAEAKFNGSLKKYPIISSYDINREGGFSLSINNLYAMGQEIKGDMIDYVFNRSESEATAVKINLDSDGMARFADTLPGMLHYNPFEVKISNTTQSTTLYAQFSSNRINAEIYYTDYLIVSENEYERETEYDYKSLKNLVKLGVAEKEYKSFWERLKKADFETPNGTTLCDKISSLWDNDGESSMMQVSFEPHYLLPIYYYYNKFNEPLFNKTPISYLMQVAEPIHVESLSFKVPMPVEEFSFKLSNFGHNRLIDRDNQDYLYFEGELTPARSDIQFYVVKGSIEEYSAIDLNDSEKGHTDGLLLDEKYVYNNSVSKPEPHVLSAENASQKFAYLVPVSDITSDTDAQTFTLYAKYTDYTGNSRFRVLDTVDNTRITTSAKEINKDVKPDFGINGNVVTADCDATIFDSLGKKIYELAPHEGIKLTSGIYFIHSHFTGETHKIIVK